MSRAWIEQLERRQLLASPLAGGWNELVTGSLPANGQKTIEFEMAKAGRVRILAQSTNNIVRFADNHTSYAAELGAGAHSVTIKQPSDSEVGFALGVYTDYAEDTWAEGKSLGALAAGTTITLQDHVGRSPVMNDVVVDTDRADYYRFTADRPLKLKLDLAAIDRPFVADQVEIRLIHDKDGDNLIETGETTIVDVPPEGMSGEVIAFTGSGAIAVTGLTNVAGTSEPNYQLTIDTLEYTVPAVTSVEATFGNSGVVHRDTKAGGMYPGIQWKDVNGQPEAADAAAPLVFAMGGPGSVNSYRSITAGFALSGMLPLGKYNVQGTATGPGGGPLTGTATVTRSEAGAYQAIVNAKINSPLPRTIDAGTLSIQWKLVHPNDANVAINYGPTELRAYVIATSKLYGSYETVIDLGARAAKGLTLSNPPTMAQQSAAALKVWREFADRSVFNLKGKRLSYWGKNTATKREMTVEELIELGTAQSPAWSYFFARAALAAGATSIRVVRVGAKDTGAGMLLKNWTFPAKPNINGPSGYVYTMASVKDAAGLPAQNNANPRANMAVHYLAYLDGTAYDAAYGTKHRTAKTAANPLLGAVLTWERNTVAGVTKVFANGKKNIQLAHKRLKPDVLVRIV